MPQENPHWEIKSVAKSLDIVDYIQEQDGATINDLTSSINLSKSTAYKHLKTLSERGYLTKEGDEYHIGVRFFHKGEYARTRKVGHRLAAQAVQDLAEKTDEEVDFLVGNNGKMIVIYESYHPDNPYGDDLTHPVEVREFAGAYYHMNTIAAGKATLASLSRDRVEEIIDQWGLPSLTEQTITNRSELYEELEHIRDQGFACQDEEYAKGLRSVAKVVHGADGNPLGAISVSGPIYRLQGEKFEEDLPNALIETVDELEEMIEKRRKEEIGSESLES
ncbi:IclR family transcriptional regulator [Haloferax profundi]|nr:IclR family transcriptional regulator [Haloferax profundi]